MSDARSSNQLATMPSIDTATGIRKLLRRAAQWDEAVLPLVRRLFARDEGRTLVAAYGDSYDGAWAYDADEVSARLEDGRYVSCVA